MENIMENQNNEQPITDFTLQELLTMAGERQHGLMSKCIAAENESHMEAFRFPCRVDAFIIGVGTEGETDVSYNLRNYHMQRNTMFIFGPNNILQVNSDERFKAHVIVISSDFLQRINIDIKNMLPIMLRFADHPCFKLTDEQSQTMRNYISTVSNEVMGPEYRFTKEIVSGLISAILYKVSDILNCYLEEHPEVENPVRDRTETYFRRFMKILGQNYRRERSVSFYAEQLCITPKYLTTLIKRVSGQSVSQWIDSYVILEAKTLLKHSRMSIQEISYYLNFPNQSFFGSYFKRNTGISPSQYKAQE